ncbi:hypothetical protein [Nocardia sp. NPDC050717]|uniref:hypothetical protein n=1 Tax=Nocardia sp. NPDC050717 TaxID=3157221 RepID=UPI0033FCF08C
MSAVRRGLSWVVSFVPLLSLGVLTWLLFAVLAIRAKSVASALAALGYLGLFALAVWAFGTQDTVFDICWSLTMIGGTAHAIVVRRKWFGRVWRPAGSGERSAVVVAEYATAAAAVGTGRPVRAGVPAHDAAEVPERGAEAVRRLLDEIDELVEESLRDGEQPDYGATYPVCPNPYCDEPWHGLRITARMASMRDFGELDDDYDHRADDSPVLCAGSADVEAWTSPDRVGIAAWREAHSVVAPPVSPPVDPAAASRARADSLWAALARPAVLIVVASWLVAMVSMFRADGPSRWLTVLVGVMAPMCLGWLYGRSGRLFPAGYVRAGLGARPAVVVAVVVMVCAGWLPMRWTGPAPAPATAYFTLVAACALACLAHAVVQIGRIRPSRHESGEVDPAAHGENLVLLGFGWMLLGLPVTLLAGWPLSYFARRPEAMWAAVAVLAVLVLTFFAEGAVVKVVSRRRDEVDLPMIAFFTVGVGALLVWSLLRIAAIPALA